MNSENGVITAIGTGTLSTDGFRWINGVWVAVPKDIVKRRRDGSFLSIGRGGGMVKVKGGVLDTVSEKGCHKVVSRRRRAAGGARAMPRGVQ